jgi:hypothetical protein
MLFSLEGSVMKIIEKPAKDSIDIDLLDPRIHIIVGVDISGDAAILTANSYEEDLYSFRVLSEAFTAGNSYGDYPTITEAIKEFQGKVEAFKDWQDAFKWLLKNS